MVLLSLALVVSACGGASASNTINVTMSEFAFDPNTSTVTSGSNVTLTAINNGAVEHEFVIFKLGTSAGDSFGPEDEGNIFWEIQVPPGETKSGTFTAPADPGEYYVTCGLKGHLEAGMIGKLIVLAP